MMSLFTFKNSKGQKISALEHAVAWSGTPQCETQSHSSLVWSQSVRSYSFVVGPSFEKCTLAILRSPYLTSQSVEVAAL